MIYCDASVPKSICALDYQSFVLFGRYKELQLAKIVVGLKHPGPVMLVV